MPHRNRGSVNKIINTPDNHPIKEQVLSSNGRNFILFKTIKKKVKCTCPLYAPLTIDVLDFWTLVLGQSVTLTAALSNSPSPSPTYQWQKNGIDIVGATNNTYTVTMAEPTVQYTGTYTCDITNIVGSTSWKQAVIILG